MAEAVLVRTVVFDEGLYAGNGDVGRWVTLVTRHFGEHTQRYAPERTGVLMDGIHWDSRRIGLRQVEGTIASEAPYTLFVLRGTTGPIMTDAHFQNPAGGVDPLTGRRVAGHWMYLAPFGGYPAVFTTEVSGQSANNFLLRAWRATARNHRSIRDRVPLFIGRP